MNTNNAQCAASLPASAMSGAPWNSALNRIQALWQEHQCRATQARAMAIFADIDTHTLRDIGAPSYIIAESTLRGDSRGLRLIDLYRS